ncbi:hypothetical protein PVAP13_6NG174206 [Panicum virgatum]|uniref:Uncharacterized protein n=1 Tax=Panicum virgatum TaxID=38727 RepID=A0A8T0QXS2_PANVG|nr:hypothetical protein PVAP13_6NG174206 [Panicum virgatum]
MSSTRCLASSNSAKSGPPPTSLIRSFLTGSVPCAPPPPPARLPPPSFDPSSPAPCPGAAGLLCERDAGSYLTAVNPHFGSHTATVGATRVPTLLPPDSTGATLVPTVSRLWISSSSSRLPFPFFSCLGQRRKLTTARLRQSCGSWRTSWSDYSNPPPVVPATQPPPFAPPDTIPAAALVGSAPTEFIPCCSRSCHGCPSTGPVPVMVVRSKLHWITRIE